MLRKLALLSLLAATLPAVGKSPNHSTGTDGLLLIDKVGGHVRFFDPATFAERSNIELPKNPHDFALSADHRFAYVPIYGSGIYNRNPEPGTRSTCSTSRSEKSRRSSTLRHIARRTAYKSTSAACST